MSVNRARRLGGCIRVSQVIGLPKVENTIGATESESLQTAKEDERNTNRELPREGLSLPKSTWQPFGESNVPQKDLEKHRDSGKPSILGTLGCTTAPSENSLAFFTKDFVCNTLTKRSSRQ